jgi:hypothetical protein
VSYDVAVWVGRLPPTDAVATQEFDQRRAAYDATREPADPALLRFISALTRRYPDLTELSDADVDESPWAGGPLVDNANGSLLYLALTRSGAAEAIPFIAATAKKRGLVCYDPQEERLVGASDEDLRPKEPLRKIATRIGREVWTSEGFRYRKGMFRKALTPGIEAVVAAMTGPGATSPLSLRGRIGVTLIPYERELEAVFGRPSSYAASMITDLGGLVPEENRHWYEDVWDEESIRALFERFRRDLHEVGLPWALSLADLSTLVTWLERRGAFHESCLLALVYRDLGRLDDCLKLLVETERELAEGAAEAERDLGHPPPMWMNEDWDQLSKHLSPTVSGGRGV